MSGGRDGEWHEWPFEPIEVLRAFGRHEVDYVLLGGIAAVLQGSPLPTYDIDIAPAPGAANDVRLHAALTDLGALPLSCADGAAGAVDTASDQRFYSPSGYIDLHPRPTGFATYAAARRNAVLLELEPGLAILVAPVRDIILSRLAAGDERQLPALEAILDHNAPS